MGDGIDTLPIVRNHDDRSTVSGLALDQTFHQIDGILIERRVGFIEQKERSVDHQLAGKFGAALHAMR